MESDATSLPLERLVSLEIIPTVTQDSDHVVDHYTNDDEDKDRLWVMSMNQLQLEETEEIHVSLVDSLQI